MPNLISSSSDGPSRLGWIGIQIGPYEDSSSDSSDSSTAPICYAARSFEEGAEMIPVPEIPVPVATGHPTARSAVAASRAGTGMASAPSRTAASSSNNASDRTEYHVIGENSEGQAAGRPIDRKMSYGMHKGKMFTQIVRDTPSYASEVEKIHG